MKFLKRFKKVQVSHRMKWILDNMKSRKSVLVVGVPEGHEIQVLLKKNKRVDVFLSEVKAHIDDAKYITEIKKQYDYVIVFSLHINLFSWIAIRDAIKGEAFIVLPVGNGSKDRVRVSTRLVRSYPLQELKSLFDLPVEAKIVRNGEYVDDDGGSYSAVTKMQLVQAAYLHFKRE